MKRSEMVEIIADTILFKTDIINSNMVSDFDASIILAALEKAGMLPPATTIFNTDDDNLPIWEPENE